MTVNDIYTAIGKSIIQSIDEEKWVKANLYIMRLEKTARFNAHYVNSKNEKINIKPRNFGIIYEDIHELHTITTEGGHNRWNRLEFTLFPDFKFDLKFIWDQELQDEVDGYNSQI